MSMPGDRLDATDESGYGAAVDGDRDETPDQAQPERGHPPTDEDAEQDNYANTDEQVR